MWIELDEFIRWKKLTRSRVWRSYALWCGRLERYTQKPLKEVNKNDILGFFETLSLKYKPRTISYAGSLIRHFFNYSNQLGYSSVPLVLLKIKQAKEQIPKIKEAEDFKKILDKIPLNTWRGLRDSLMLRLLWDCALRVGELVSLDISHLNITEMTAKIKVEKSYEERYIFWGKETNEVLKKYLGIRQGIVVNTDALFIGKGRYVFYSSRLTERSVQRALAEYGLKPHMIRHSKVHDMLRRGATLHDVHYILRHSANNLKSVLQYSKWWGPEQERSARRYL